MEHEIDRGIGTAVVVCHPSICYSKRELSQKVKFSISLALIVAWNH